MGSQIFKNDVSGKALNSGKNLFCFVLFCSVDFDLEWILLWNDWINTGVSNVKKLRGKHVKQNNCFPAH